MSFFNIYVYFGFLLLFYTKYLLAYQCHDCTSMVFNYSITIDNLPSPTRDDCQIVSSISGCFVRVAWHNGQTSDVSYGANLGFPLDSVVVTTERQASILSNLYTTQKYISFICGSSDEIPCNTVENLKRTVISTTLPSDEQITQFNDLLIPTKAFNGSLCFDFSNMTDYCSATDPENCQQCLIAVEYTEEISVCAACPEGEANWNFFDYYTSFFLNNRTRLDRISFGCQKGDVCNSMKNMEEVKQTIMSKFDFDNFFYSTASTTKPISILLLITLYIGLLRSF